MRGRRTKPLGVTLALWTAGCSFALWGGWQAINFRRTLLAEVGRSEARAALQGYGAPITTRAAIAVGGATVTLEKQPGDEQGPTIDLLDPLLAAPSAPVAGMGEPSTVVPGPPLNLDMPVADLISQGRKWLDDGRIVKGRTLINVALSRTTDPAEAALLRRTLTDLNAAVFLGTAVMPEDHAARYVEIRPGDNFVKLGRRYAVPGPFLASINPNLNPRNLKPLTGVKIVQGPYELRLQKSAARLDLYARDLYVRSYPVELPEGNYLPRGSYKLSSESKIQVAGRRWIGFEGMEPATEGVAAGWIYGLAGPRGSASRDRSSGIRMADADLGVVFMVVSESRSHLCVEP